MTPGRLTGRAARAVGIEDAHGLAPGLEADLVVLDGTSVDDVVSDRPPPVLVMKAARIVALGAGAARIGLGTVDP